MLAEDTLVPTNGVTLATTAAGEGPVVLLVHGFPHTRQLWSAVLSDLATSWRVVAADLRLQPPTLAVGSQPVGDNLARQLEPLTDDLRTAHLDGTGHIIPLDDPAGLIALLRSFL